MAYAFQDEIAGLPGMRQVDTAPRSPAYPGMLSHAVDPLDGGGEFIYLQGVAGVAAGQVVTYSNLGASALALVAAHGSPVAVAMAAIGAGQFGWFQISGLARPQKAAGAVAVASGLAISATPGVLTGVAAATPLGSGTLDGAVVAAAALAGDAAVICQISRPTIA
jgi:hypothetical protein